LSSSEEEASCPLLFIRVIILAMEYSIGNFQEHQEELEVIYLIQQFVYADGIN
jgi:hypothetical protein